MSADTDDYDLDDVERLTDTLYYNRMDILRCHAQIAKILTAHPRLATGMLSHPLEEMQLDEVDAYVALGKAGWLEAAIGGVDGFPTLPPDLRSLAWLAMLTRYQLATLDARRPLANLVPSEVAREVQAVLTFDSGGRWTPCSDCQVQRSTAQAVFRAKGLVDDALQELPAGRARERLLDAIDEMLAGVRLALSAPEDESRPTARGADDGQSGGAAGPGTSPPSDRTAV